MYSVCLLQVAGSCLTGANSNDFVGNVVIADIACALMDGGHGSQFVECMVLVVSSNRQIIYVQAQ
jgi:hypothetical protein